MASFQMLSYPVVSTTTITPVLLFLLFFFISLIATAEKTNSSSTIGLGSWLSPKDYHTSWASSSGHFAFGFYPEQDGFAVGIWLVSPQSSENTTTTIVWTANRDNPNLVSSNSILNLTMQGLLLQNGKEDLPYNFLPGDQDSEPVVLASASMHDSGNFVLYDKHFNVVWESFGYPTDTILGGQSYRNDGDLALVSSRSKSDHSSGRFYLGMQSYGNLVAYPMNSQRKNEDIYWSSHGVLNLTKEGFLCLDPYFSFDVPRCLNDNTNKSRKNTSTSIYRATLEVDGNFILYEHQFEGSNTTTNTHVKVLWQALNYTCQVNGFCGLNSYCSISGNNAAECVCFPGFIIPSNSKISAPMPQDCVQTRRKDDCESSDDPTVLYNVTRLKSMIWGDVPYLIIPTEMESTCEKACWEDCECGGALYSSGICKKYRLPLMYGRMIQNDSSTGVLKIPSGVFISPNSIDVPKAMVVVDNKKSLIIILAFTLGCISLICTVFVAYVFFTYKRQFYKYKMLSESSENLGFDAEDCSLRSFSFDELVKSTRGFTEEIGRGSFGAVYSGIIGGVSNKKIAVKRIDDDAAAKGERDFRAEITAIAQTHHRNLVKLVGFCIDGTRKLLVYEYLSNGSLANLLFEGNTQVSWKERMKIALDVARGLLYLHEECQVRIIHCNINPRNILMDEAWTAKISDFGLARLLRREYNSRTKKGNDDGGTSRYLAPELHEDDASISAKADIYSFGMILLEIICRRRSIEINASSADEILHSSWIYQCFVAGELNKLIRLEEEQDVDWNILEKMVKVGLWCVQDHPSLRPSMKSVILMLDGLKNIPAPPPPARLVEISLL